MRRGCRIVRTAGRTPTRPRPSPARCPVRARRSGARRRRATARRRSDCTSLAPPRPEGAARRRNRAPRGTPPPRSTRCRSGCAPAARRRWPGRSRSAIRAAHSRDGCRRGDAGRHRAGDDEAEPQPAPERGRSQPERRARSAGPDRPQGRPAPAPASAVPAEGPPKPLHATNAAASASVATGTTFLAVHQYSGPSVGLDGLQRHPDALGVLIRPAVGWRHGHPAVEHRVAVVVAVAAGHSRGVRHVGAHLPEA